jgi:DNA-binding GntR family transcriptional regulator
MAPPPEPRQGADWLRAVAQEVRTFDRSSTAERVAELLRHRVDLCRLRRTIQCDDVRRLDRLDPVRLRPLHDDVAAGEDAARRDDRDAAGTANMRFHQHLVALAGSRRIDRAAKELEVYLHDSETQLVGAFRERSGRNP